MFVKNNQVLSVIKYSSLMSTHLFEFTKINLVKSKLMSNGWINTMVNLNTFSTKMLID